MDTWILVATAGATANFSNLGYTAHQKLAPMITERHIHNGFLNEDHNKKTDFVQKAGRGQMF